MIRDREQINHRRLLTLLKSHKNITVIAPSNINEAVGVVSCVFDGYSSDDIGKVLNECGIAVRSGLHCSPDAHRYLGTFPGGTVRFSVSYFNDENDFQILHNALSYIYENS